MATTSTRAGVSYPESDGKPMAETTFHRDVMIEMIVGLRDWFAADPMAYVSGNEFVYWVEGQPRRVVSPDVWLARGVDKTRPRRSYKTWEDGGKGPDFVLEVTSRSTGREDLTHKYTLYRDDLKVREYFLFDPLDEYLKPRLQGHRLAAGEYVPLEPRDGRLPSEVLGLHLEADGRMLALHDPATGRRLLNRLEALQEERKARLRRDATIRRKNAEIRQKDEALRQAEEEVERLRREVEALRGGKKPRRT